MVSSNPAQARLTQHDRDVLKKITLNARIPDTEVAKQIGISPQGVFKIRQKLEEKGIIKGYIPVIDYKKIGINVITIVLIRLTPEAWNKNTEEEISEKIAHVPLITGAYRVTQGETTHILMMAFRNLNEKDRYMRYLQTHDGSEFVIQREYTFPVENIIVRKPIDIFTGLDETRDLKEYDFLRKTISKIRKQGNRLYNDYYKFIPDI